MRGKSELDRKLEEMCGGGAVSPKLTVTYERIRYETCVIPDADTQEYKVYVIYDRKTDEHFSCGEGTTLKSCGKPPSKEEAGDDSRASLKFQASLNCCEKDYTTYTTEPQGFSNSLGAGGGNRSATIHVEAPDGYTGNATGVEVCATHTVTEYNVTASNMSDCKGQGDPKTEVSKVVWSFGSSYTYQLSATGCDCCCDSYTHSPVDGHLIPTITSAYTTGSTHSYSFKILRTVY